MAPSREGGNCVTTLKRHFANGKSVVQATAGAPRTVLKGPDGSVGGLPGLGGFNLTHLKKKMLKSNWIMKPQVSGWKRNNIKHNYLKPPKHVTNNCWNHL